jgi:hypothetical protein
MPSPGQAVFADSTGGDVGLNCHPIPLLEALDVLSPFSDLSGEFMAHDHGDPAADPFTRADMEVRSAHSSCQDSDEHMIVRAGRLLDLPHLHAFRLVLFFDQGSHEKSFISKNPYASPSPIFSADTG